MPPPSSWIRCTICKPGQYGAPDRLIVVALVHSGWTPPQPSIVAPFWLNLPPTAVGSREMPRTEMPKFLDWSHVWNVSVVPTGKGQVFAEAFIVVPAAS